MNIIYKFKPLLFIVPFGLIIMVGKLLNVYPNLKQVKVYRDDLYTKITEKNLDDLLSFANITKTSVFKFQTLRLVISLLTFVLLASLYKNPKSLILSGIFALFIYKYFYFYLVNRENQIIKRLNRELPYDIKTIIYLNHIYPVTNALEKAIEYVSNSFKEDIKILVSDIDVDPNSYVPYQNFINRYGGRLNNLDFYLRILYRLNISSKDEEKLLQNMNSAISSEINRVRKMKNETINSTIQYLGMLPVVLTTAMLTYVLVIVSKTI